MIPLIQASPSALRSPVDSTFLLQDPTSSPVSWSKRFSQGWELMFSSAFCRPPPPSWILGALWHHVVVGCWPQPWNQSGWWLSAVWHVEQGAAKRRCSCHQPHGRVSAVTPPQLAAR